MKLYGAVLNSALMKKFRVVDCFITDICENCINILNSGVRFERNVSAALSSLFFFFIKNQFSERPV